MMKMLLTCFIDDPETIVAIQGTDGEVDAHGMLTVVTEKGERWRIPRSSIMTPVECCPKCLRPLEIRSADKAYCPHFEHHLYEKFYAKSHDLIYNRPQRRVFEKKAHHYLLIHQKRIKDEVANREAEIRLFGE